MAGEPIIKSYCDTNKFFSITDYAVISHTVAAITKNDKVALPAFRYFYSGSRPEFYQLVNVDKICSDLTKLLAGAKVSDTHRALSALIGFYSKPLSLTKWQAEQITQLRDLISTIKVRPCAHDRLAIIPLLHGGGFTRDYAMPELVCHRCWLNVTLGRKPPEELGLMVSAKDLKAFLKFADECYESQAIQVQSSRNIVGSPRETYEKSQKYMGKGTVLITDKALLESCSSM